MSEAKAKLENCEVCGENTAKYTCPKCEVRTCCLKCVNIHKKELECDGNRDKTRYVPMSKFTNLDLLSDYRLLEEVTRSIENMKEDNKKRFIHCKSNILPSHLYKLRKALENESIKLQFLPPTFDRHKANTTYLDFKTKQIYWHIEWIFTNAENIKLIDEKCPSDKKLSEIVHKYLDPNYENDKLKFYQSVGMSGISLFLKAENKPPNKFYKLDHDISLNESFKGKTIIEYPIIHVVLKDHEILYDVIDSDDEDTEEDLKTEENNANKIVNKLIKSEQKNEENNRKNYLFGTEYSEGELSSD